MKSFRTEIENPIVKHEIIELEKKIFEYKQGTLDEEKFRSLRLARGVYGQRQQGVQMIRIKLPYGKVSAQQLRRISEVSDEYSNGNLHITTRQDIQIHYVDLAHTPQLWSDLEKDNITLREACGNTVRNVTASIFAGVDIDEPFDVTPYAHAFFEYFLRNPICQDMGRKFKVAFSSSSADHAMTFIHDLGFIPKIKENQHGFKVMLGGGIGSQPRSADCISEFMPVDQMLPFSEAVIRVFDRYGERNRRNKARLKFLVKDLGIISFLKLVAEEKKGISQPSIPIPYHEIKLKQTPLFKSTLQETDKGFRFWKKSNVYLQKQQGYVSVGVPIETGNFSTQTARQLADIVEVFCAEDIRLTPAQSILLRSIKKENLLALYQALTKIGLDRAGFHKINDIVACPGTDTCNLGIASSMGLAKKLHDVIEHEFHDLIAQHQISIKISGCMNACGQHTIADIGFQGMTIKSNGAIAPATQVLLGGGVFRDGKGSFADKILKVPAKRTPKVLRWLLKDFKKNRENEELYKEYVARKTSNYFYQNLKHFSEIRDLTADDFVDWGNQNKYKKAIGIGECAGVTIDLVQTLLFDAEEQLEKAQQEYKNSNWSNSIYYSYAAQIRAAKALLTTVNAKINAHDSIIEAFDEHFKVYENNVGTRYSETARLIQTQKPTESFALQYAEEAKKLLVWINHYRLKNAK